MNGWRKDKPTIGVYVEVWTGAGYATAQWTGSAWLTADGMEVQYITHWRELHHAA